MDQSGSLHEPPLHGLGSGHLQRVPVFIMTPNTTKATRKRNRQYMGKVGAKAAAVPDMAT